MSTNETVLYPANPHVEVPSETELIRRLVDGGFIKASGEAHTRFELELAFMTESELESRKRALAAGSFQVDPPVTVATFDSPKLFASAQLQYLEQIRSPAGNAWGNRELAYKYLQNLYDNPDATATDPISGRTYYVWELDLRVQPGTDERQSRSAVTAVKKTVASARSVELSGSR